MVGRKKKSTTASTTVDSIKHPDKRTNIPTEELRDFVAEDEASPAALLYPRDPSLDPQLVWKGKDEQDRHPLEVPVVPVYIQEKIHPQAIIEDFLSHMAKADGVRESAHTYQASLFLFGDFNGLSEEFDQRVDFYHHDQNWSNRMILGDSLLVMTSLAEKEGLKGKVQMIYIDPPYGISFKSNWQVSTKKRNLSDGKSEDVTRQPEQVRAFRDTWSLGIHSYLNYLRDRLQISHSLLSDSGSIFVQIGDENVHLIRNLLDEIFGSENFCREIIFAKSSAQSSTILPGVNDFLLWYAKNKNQVKYRELFSDKDPFENPSERYICLVTPDEKIIDLSVKQKRGDASLLDGRICRLYPLFSQTAGKSSEYEYNYHGSSFWPPRPYGWQTTPQGMKRFEYANRLHSIGKSLRGKVFHDEFPFKITNSIWLDLRPGGFGEQRVYVVQTDPRAIARCLLMTTDPGDLVIDPTCGSGTTAYIAELWGRRWITIDTSRVALALARTRLMAAKYPYYLLADSPEGLEKEAELTNQRAPTYTTKYDIKKGFVNKKVPHITLKSIANNEEIDAIYEKFQLQMEPIREKINKAAKKEWQEWEIPREVKGNDNVNSLIQQLWDLRRQRQQVIDESIARHAEAVTFYDQSYHDPKRVRVSGPFTVESLSPHRILPADEDMDGSVSEAEAKQQQDFAGIIFDNLRKAGVQNTKKAERLVFDTLDVYPGKWLHAVGAYRETDGSSKRVAVSLGPEHGTVSPQQVKEAAKEAVQGIGFDLLLVCGFAFDPHVSEEMTRYGKLQVLAVRMNPDLAMGDELLKKTGTGNLFMIFGEPDLDVRRQPDGSIVAELKGIDVYDPTTGQVRSSSTDDIACWFIDTDYNGESFFVRHAYFTGAGEPYERLRKALRAEINEDAWSSIYSTVSRPFAPPETGKIAVKVINHYGDEVLKVYSVGGGID